MIDPQIAVSAVSTALTAIQTLIGIAKDRKDPELIGKIIDFQSAILQLQTTLTEYQQENTSLREELTLLKQEQVTDKQLLYREGVWWHWVGDTLEGGFCPLCWGHDRKLVHTQKYEAGNRNYHRCEIHKAEFC